MLVESHYVYTLESAFWTLYERNEYIYIYMYIWSQDSKYTELFNSSIHFNIGVGESHSVNISCHSSQQ